MHYVLNTSTNQLNSPIKIIVRQQKFLFQFQFLNIPLHNEGELEGYFLLIMMNLIKYNNTKVIGVIQRK